MNQLSTERRAAVVSALVEGNSLRATARMTGVARMTVEKLLRELGAACALYHDSTVRNLKSRRVQCDEIWAFCHAKRRNVTPEMLKRNPDAGDVWTWTAIDADSKLIISYRVGDHGAAMAHEFIADVKSRLSNRIQLTTDGYHLYMNAVDNNFGTDIDYAILEKRYAAPEASRAASARYSPARIISVRAATLSGDPDRKHISTSHVERQNLTMRMHMRRFTRLTNGFSKKIENHAHSVALHFIYYNFCKIHQTIRVTPAMEAGLTDRPLELQDLVALLDSALSQSA